MHYRYAPAAASRLTVAAMVLDRIVAMRAEPLSRRTPVGGRRRRQLGLGGGGGWQCLRRGLRAADRTPGPQIAWWGRGQRERSLGAAWVPPQAPGGHTQTCELRASICAVQPGLLLQRRRGQRRRRARAGESPTSGRFWSVGAALGVEFSRQNFQAVAPVPGVFIGLLRRAVLSSDGPTSWLARPLVLRHCQIPAAARPGALEQLPNVSSGRLSLSCPLYLLLQLWKPQLINAPELIEPSATQPCPPPPAPPAAAAPTTTPAASTCRRTCRCCADGLLPLTCSVCRGQQGWQHVCRLQAQPWQRRGGAVRAPTRPPALSPSALLQPYMHDKVLLVPRYVFPKASG